MPNVRFRVSLSNGDTLVEDKGILEEHDGELSAWNKLIKYRAEKKAKITSLSLFTEKGQTFNLPSSGRTPKFRAFDLAEQPFDYLMERKIGRNIAIADRKIKKVQISDHFTCAVALYKNFRLEIWVDEENPRNSWVLARAYD